MKTRLQFLLVAMVGLLVTSLVVGWIVWEILCHLLFGFLPFLWRNLERMSFNADTLIPGILAFVLFVIILHFALRSLAKRNETPWPVRSTCVVALLLPALFGISLLVPGILFQIQELRRTL